MHRHISLDATMLNIPFIIIAIDQIFFGDGMAVVVGEMVETDGFAGSLAGGVGVPLETEFEGVADGGLVGVGGGEEGQGQEEEGE